MLDTPPSWQIDSYYDRSNSRRNPEWRLERANDFANMPRFRAEDRFTRALVCVITGDKQRCDFDDAELSMLLEKAFAIRNVRMHRLCLESRVLAYRETRSAAEFCGLPQELVNVYLEAFFDVESKIDTRGWIMNRVIRDGRYQLDFVRRQLYRDAYLGGPYVVEHWLNHLPYLDQGINHDLTSQIGLERERLEIALLLEKMTKPFTLRQREAFEAECSSTASDTGSTASILRELAVTEMSSQVGEDVLSRAFAADVGNQSRELSDRASRDQRVCSPTPTRMIA